MSYVVCIILKIVFDTCFIAYQYLKKTEVSIMNKQNAQSVFIFKCAYTILEGYRLAKCDIVFE